MPSAGENIARAISLDSRYEHLNLKLLLKKAVILVTAFFIAVITA